MDFTSPIDFFTVLVVFTGHNHAGLGITRAGKIFTKTGKLPGYDGYQKAA
jgi:hypothetical protein